MSAKNVETLHAVHDCWNKRDFDGVVHNVVENPIYTDHAFFDRMDTREKFRRWTAGWVASFSDWRITNPTYIDAGDTVVAQFTAEGTNDGELLSQKPTGRKVSLTFCQSFQFDEKGQIVSGDCYYDRYALFFQLGQIQRPS
jgi:predicted ester cyclase